MNFAKPTTQSAVAPSRLGSMPRKSPAPSSRNTPSASSMKSTGFGASHGNMGLTPHRLLMLVWMIAVLLLGLGGVHVIRSVLDRPDVYTSYMTRECVKVVKADGSEGSCANLPETYNNIWVE